MHLAFFSPTPVISWVLSMVIKCFLKIQYLVMMQLFGSYKAGYNLFAHFPFQLFSKTRNYGQQPCTPIFVCTSNNFPFFSSSKMSAGWLTQSNKRFLSSSLCWGPVLGLETQRRWLRVVEEALK